MTMSYNKIFSLLALKKPAPLKIFKAIFKGNVLDGPVAQSRAPAFKLVSRVDLGPAHF